MANINSDRYDVTPYKPKAGEVGCMYATVTISAQQSVSDTMTFFDLPQDAMVLGGSVKGDDIDTGTETYDFDIGTSGDTDKYLNGGVQSGDAIAGIKPDVGIYALLGGTLLTGGLNSALTAEETVIGTVVAQSNAGHTGALSLIMFYTSA